MEEQLYQQLLQDVDNAVVEFHQIINVGLQSKDCAKKHTKRKFDSISEKAEGLPKKQKKLTLDMIDLKRRAIDNYTPTNDNHTASKSAVYQDCHTLGNSTQHFTQTGNHALSGDQHGQDQPGSSTSSQYTTEQEEQSSSIKDAISGLQLSLLTWRITYNVSDNGMNELCSLLKTFLSVLTTALPCLAAHAKQFPKTLSTIPSILNLKAPAQMETILTCPKCYTLYPEWTSTPTEEQLTCSNLGASGERCGEELYQSVRPASGGTLYRPLKTYCYQPVHKSLQQLLERPGIEDECEKWRYVTN